MLLNEMQTLPEVINNITYLQNETEETRNNIVDFIKTKYGNRTVFTGYADNPTIAGKLINALYNKKWDVVKKTLAEEIPITERPTHDIETKTNVIFGYDGAGTNDSKIVTEHDGNDEYYNIYGQFKSSFDFYNNFSYYGIVISDIVKELTNSVYE